jgi:hypothetical protein
MMEVTYLGHRINAKGLHPIRSKVEAVKKFPTPKDLTELRAFLGMLNYYRHFLPRVSEKLEPLHRLLRNGVQWKWTQEQESAFRKAKKLLTSSAVLVHFDSKLPLVLECDASPAGVGAVLSHRTSDGQVRPIAYASRSLCEAEKGYAQIDREALALIFGVKKFHKYLCGHHFLLRSDHKPLLFLFGEKSGIPVLASARLQHWALILSAYSYTLEFVRGEENGSDDALSRLPLATPEREISVPVEIAYTQAVMDSSPMTFQDIAAWTKVDPVLSQVLTWVLSGWPEVLLSSRNTDVDFKPYISRRLELSAQGGCILWGNRVVVPPQGRKILLEELHDTHPGITRMNAFACLYFWWPKFDEEIASIACDRCAELRHVPPSIPLVPWPFLHPRGRASKWIM